MKRLAALAILLTGCPSFDRVAQQNLPPVAAISVSPEGAIPNGVQVFLSATGSHDPEARPIASYKWAQVSGDTVVLQHSTEPVASFVTPDRPQKLLFSLVVSEWPISPIGVS